MRTAWGASKHSEIGSGLNREGQVCARKRHTNQMRTVCRVLSIGLIRLDASLVFNPHSLSLWSNLTVAIICFGTFAGQFPATSDG